MRGGEWQTERWRRVGKRQKGERDTGRVRKRGRVPERLGEWIVGRLGKGVEGRLLC